MNNMSELLSQYDANLRAIVSEYKAFGQMRMVQVLSPAVRERIQAEVANFVQAKKQQLDAASKLLAGLADFATPAPPAAVGDAFSSVSAQPSASLDLGPLPPIEPVLEPTLPSPKGVVRITTSDEWDDDSPLPETQVEEPPPVDEIPDEPKAKAGHDGHTDRPKPRKSQGSAVPVKENPTTQRTDAPDKAPTATPQQGRRIRKNQRKREGMAAIASVSEGDIQSNAVGGLTGDTDSVSDPNDFIRTESRSTDPDADSNNDFDRVVEKTREMQASARMAKSKRPDSMLLIPEALIVDSTGVTVGRASRIYKSGKQIEIDEMELYLGDDGLAGDWSSEIALADGESVWRSILKRREIFEFRGSKKVFSASLGNGRLLGFDENDENVLVVEEVVLAKAPEPVGGPVRG